jgi:YD repeat-containing protein
MAGGWTSTNGIAPQQRCTQFGKPAPAWDMNRSSTWTGDEFWNGTFLYVPGMGDQEVLRRGANNTQAPADGHSYPLVTRNHWQFRCLAGLANDTSPGKVAGQGFIAVSPEGTTYQFDQMVSRATSFLEKPVPRPLGTESTAPGPRVGSLAIDATPNQYYDLRMRRAEVWMLPTRITDRFGNTVTYVYGADDPWKLTSITANDAAGSPRRITLSYHAGSHRIASVGDGSRTWSYSYSGTGETAVLSTVTLPDNSAWQLAGASALMMDLQYVSEGNPSCDSGGILAPQELSATLVHPSGAAAAFTLRPTMHARSGVPNECLIENRGERSRYPNFFANHALIRKTVSGPGLAPMTWSTAYAEPVASWEPCNGCVATSSTEVTEPSGARLRYTFGTLFRQTEGQLQQVDVIDTGGSVLRSTTTRYQDPASGTWPNPIGHSEQPRGDGVFSSKAEVVKQRTTTQQGVDFTWTANSFDARARPLSVTRASMPGSGRTDTTAYVDNTVIWMLGQVGSVTENSSGKVAVLNEYDPTTSTLLRISQFGRLDETRTYHPDGTLATQKDGLGRITAYSNYMRGLAQKVVYADTTAEGVTVNNYGAVTSTTDANSYTTSYGYDAMGRLASVTQPTGDSVAWNRTDLVFQPVQSQEFDLAPGHWRQDITTGNARTSTFYDALWRPVYNHTADIGQPATTSRMVKRAYDAAGHLSFQSYPRRVLDASISEGVHHEFDALGRQTVTSATSELGVLYSRNAYLTGFKKQFTDPRGNSIITAYQAFDQPTENAISNIAAPEGVNIAIARDVFGKPLSVTRGGAGKIARRSYVYDRYERLCKSIEPETGATVQDYDAANNVSWRASGLGLPSTVNCDTASVPAAKKISYGYDTRNRLTGTTYGDASPAITRSYTPDGLPGTISSNGIVWTNRYNKRRLNERESMAYGGATYTVDRAYDANGSLRLLTYPDLTGIDYAPNALGEPSKAGKFASAVTYHPNGAIAGFTYGNGIVRTLAQNARGLPDVSTDGGVLSDKYTYDESANVKVIDDRQEGIGTRTMRYDNLDRLTGTTSAATFGVVANTYDTLDNLTGVTVSQGPTARTTLHTVDPITNLLKSISSATSAYNLLYGYDSQGNITARGGQGFVFDQGNRLRSATGKVTYAYDGLGHRASTVGADGVNRVSVYTQGGRLLYLRATSAPLAAGTRYIYLGRHQIAEVKAAGAN